MGEPLPLCTAQVRALVAEVHEGAVQPRGSRHGARGGPLQGAPYYTLRQEGTARGLSEIANKTDLCKSPYQAP